MVMTRVPHDLPRRFHWMADYYLIGLGSVSGEKTHAAQLLRIQGKDWGDPSGKLYAEVDSLCGAHVELIVDGDPPPSFTVLRLDKVVEQLEIGSRMVRCSKCRNYLFNTAENAR